MSVKFYLVASLVLVIKAATDLPAKGSDVSDPNYQVGLQNNMQETTDARQKREAIAEQGDTDVTVKSLKNTNGERKFSKRKWKSSERKVNTKNNSGRKKKTAKRKTKSSKGKETGKGNPTRITKSSRSRQKSSKGKVNEKHKTNRKIKSSKTKRTSNKGKRKSKKGKRKSKKGNRKSKKEKRKSKKGKRKSNKGKKKSKKGKRKSKKRKGKSKKEKRKSKKEKRKSSKGKGNGKEKSEINRKSSKGKLKSKGKPNSQLRQTTSKVNLTCLRDAVTFTKFLKDNVINFLRKNTRLTRQNSLTNKKSQKKGEYKEPAARLIQAGGGDKTNLSCSGSTTNNGATKLKTVTDVLDACELGIKKACEPPSSINTTTLDTCKTNALAFNKTVSQCIIKATGGQDACSCFQDAEVLKEKKVLENCKGTKEAKAAAKARTACLKVISRCKNATTQAATLQYACSYSAADLLKTLKQLTANSAAFKGLLDKIKELTGLSPSMGPTDNSTSRQVRSEEENEEDAIFDSHQARLRGKRQLQACSTINVTITTCTTTISNKPASSDVVEKCKTPTYTIGECSDADKAAIQESLNDALDKNAILIAFIESVTAELKEITGTTPKASDLASSSTAKAASRSRSMLRKMIMEKMNLQN